MVNGVSGASTFTGDAIAVAMVVINALYMVLIRIFRTADPNLAAAYSGLQLFVLGWLFSDPLNVTRRDAVLLIVFGCIFALATVLWTEGTLRIPAAESGLLGSAETPMAIVFAWIILSEIPPAATIIGGAIVLSAVIGRVAADRQLGKRPE